MDAYPLPDPGSALFVSHQGHADPGRRWDVRHPSALLPGSFNPIHAGHLGLAAVAAEMLGLEVAFEISVANVDKPALTAAEVGRRVAQLRGSALWLTHARRFVEKATLFPGAVFVVGTDTAARIVDPRYYGDAAALGHALAQVRANGCRFLVACRIDAEGRCLEAADVPVPPSERDLFLAIPAHRFRLDISSTALRQSGIK